jgi:hypothetical protein
MNRPTDRAETSPVVRWLLWLFFIFVALLALVGLAFGLFALRWWAEQRVAAGAVEKEVARLRAAGEPFTIDDLYDFHKLPPGVLDATPAWLAAMKSYDAARFNQDAKGLPYVGDGSPSMLDSEAGRLAAEQFLTDYHATIQAVLAAARGPGECRYLARFERGFSGIPSEAQNTRTLVRLLALNAHIQASKDGSAEAVESLTAMYAVSDTLSHQLTLVEQQVRLATLSVAMQQTELVLKEAELTPAQCGQLVQCLQSCDIQGSFTRSLIGERALGYNAFLTASPVTRSPDCEKYLDWMAAAITFSSEPLPAGRDSFQAAVESFGSVQNKAATWSKNKYVLTANVLPALVRTFDAYSKCAAQRDALLDQLRNAAKQSRNRTEFDRVQPFQTSL